jgi:arylsulfatase A-like enzyme
MRGRKTRKNTFFEEASRVPLFMAFPGTIEPNAEVNELVSHLDIFSTMLDYSGAIEADNSDGKRLRPKDGLQQRFR